MRDARPGSATGAVAPPVIVEVGEWPEPALLLHEFGDMGVTGADLLFERLCRTPGSGLLTAAGEWESEAVRRRYDLEQWPQRGHRCACCLAAISQHAGRFCAAHLGYRYRSGWRHRAALVLCAVDGVPVWSATARTGRPHPVCPRLPGDPDPGPSACEEAYARLLARARQARRRERRRAAAAPAAAAAARAFVPAPEAWLDDILGP